MAYKEKCRGCINENKCDYISCILEKKRITLNATEDAEELIHDKDMRYTEALRKLFEVMEGRTDIWVVIFNRESDSLDVISCTGTQKRFKKEYIHDKDMRYTETLRKLFEVMEGRADIWAVEFNRESNSFDVISCTGTHICFCDEFRNK